jgi:hypothetical protein
MHPIVSDEGTAPMPLIPNNDFIIGSHFSHRDRAASLIAPSPDSRCDAWRPMEFAFASESNSNFAASTP